MKMIHFWLNEPIELLEFHNRYIENHHCPYSNSECLIEIDMKDTYRRVSFN